MNVIVSNKQSDVLFNLDLDVIKNVTGEYTANEIVEMFKNLFFDKLILDVTALKNYEDSNSYTFFKDNFDLNKIILFLPQDSTVCSPSFLSNFVKLGIYNFTTNVNGIKFLIKKTNTLQDVENIVKMASKSAPQPVNDSNVNNINSNSDLTAPASVAPKAGGKTTVIGFKNVTLSAGATTLIYMLKKELIMTYGSEKVLAIEVDKKDFALFNDKDMVSSTSTTIKTDLERHSDKDVILVDLNKCNDTSFCEDVVWLMEPSTIKLNRLVRENRIMFSKLVGQKVILNQSLLLASDVSDFEKETGLKIFYNMPPLDERKRNSIINDFLIQLGLLTSGLHDDGGSNKIFGLFRR